MEEGKFNYRTTARLARIIIEDDPNADDSDVYYYVGKENEVIFERIFQFCQQHLDLTSENNLRKGAFLYFSNDLGVNARAHPKSIIRINFGLIDELIKKY